MIGGTTMAHDEIGPELRRTPRVQLIYYMRLFETGTRNPCGHLVNVNPTGVMLMGRRRFKPGRTYSFTMDLPRLYDDTKHIEFQGEPLWCRVLEDTKVYHTGVKFTAIADGDKRLLERIADEFYREDFSGSVSDEMNPPEIIDKSEDEP
jgi:PilZ domain